MEKLWMAKWFVFRLLGELENLYKWGCTKKCPVHRRTYQDETLS